MPSELPSCMLSVDVALDSVTAVTGSVGGSNCSRLLFQAEQQGMFVEVT